MEILSIIGTRPQYIKLGAICRKFAEVGVNHQYIDTGQHYSNSLSNQIIQDLGLPEPLINLKVGSLSPVLQISNIAIRLNEALTQNRPKFVFVYGDTNSTLAAAITLKKLGIPFGHIEAGLRSFNPAMPEEINRVLTDHASTRLYAPSLTAVENLRNENLGKKTLFTGDLMVEALKHILEKKSDIKIPENIYYVATFHREENMISIERLKSIFYQLSLIEEDIILFGHPRLIEILRKNEIDISPNIKVSEPVSHSTLINYVFNCRGVITDSGGLQKEAYMVGKLCTTVRSELEWVETTENNWNVLCTELKSLADLVKRDIPAFAVRPMYGNGNASQLICEDVEDYLK